jgi:hypothetical protein
MTEKTEVKKDSDWRKFIEQHWSMFVVFVAAGVLAFAGAVYVFWRFAGNAQSTGLVPSTLNLWTMGNLVVFTLTLILWELVIIGIPVAVVAVSGWQWWKRLPAEEREYRIFGKSSRSRNAGGAISPLLFIAFAIKVYVDGKWDVALSTYTVNYVVDSLITILIWVAVIFGIPAAIGLLWWIHHELNNKP